MEGERDQPVEGEGAEAAEGKGAEGEERGADQPVEDGGAPRARVPRASATSLWRTRAPRARVPRTSVEGEGAVRVLVEASVQPAGLTDEAEGKAICRPCRGWLQEQSVSVLCHPLHPFKPPPISRVIVLRVYAKFLQRQHLRSG